MKTMKQYGKILWASVLIFSLCAAFLSFSAPAAHAAAGTGGKLSAEDLFTERDLEQEADLSEAVSCSVSSGALISITEAGVYQLSGTGDEVLILVDAPEDAKVQLVLDGVSISNTSVPCIYVRSADKVFVTTVSDSYLSVSGTFAADGDTNTDGVIFSREDLVLNGIGTLSISSSMHGVVGKDDLKITGGTYTISAASHAIEAKDSIRISDGSFTLRAGKDGLHTENEEDPALGYLYIGGGSFTISAGDDGIHAESLIQIDGGSFSMDAAEGVESTYVQINDGVFSIQSWDDGINAAQKSSAYRATVEINGGEIAIVMGAGDTDGVDSNGELIINGGTINVTGGSTFDCDGTVSFNGGTVIVNGQQVSTIPNQMMGGRGGMGFGGRNWGGQNNRETPDMQNGWEEPNGQTGWNQPSGQNSQGGWGSPGGHHGW